MTTSGSTAFNLDLVDLVEEAGERAGFEIRTGYDMRSARRSMNLMFADWANRGLNMFTFEQLSQALTPGTAAYTLPADTVDVMEAVVRTGTAQNQTDIAISRISVSTYATIPNKNQQARPLQYFVRRGVDAPTVTLWPVPDNSQTYTLVYWRLRRIQDAGDGVNTMDMPWQRHALAFNFLQAVALDRSHIVVLAHNNRQFAWRFGIDLPSLGELQV